ILKSKFSIILLINFTLLVLLISRFNRVFFLFEYGYEPLFLLNIIILTVGLFIRIVVDKKIKITLFEILVYTLTVWLIISIIFNSSEHPINGLNFGGVFNIITPMLFVTLIYLWKDEVTLKHIINILGYMCIIAAIIGSSALITILFPDIMIKIFNWDTEEINRGTISRIKNGFFLSLFIIPSISLFIYYDKKNIRYIFLLCFIFILLGLIATGRRGSYFPVIIFIVIFFMIIILRNFTKKGLRKYFKYFVMVAFFFIVFSIYLINSGDVGRLFGQVDTQKDNIGRLTRMQPAIEFILEKPYMGDGIGNFYYRTNKRIISDVKSVHYNNWIQLSDPHNTYIMVAAESGIIGLLIFLLILFYVLFKLKPHDIISLGILMGVCIFFLNCMVDTRMWKGLVRLDTVFWMFVGLGIIYNQKFKDRQKDKCKKT